MATIMSIEKIVSRLLKAFPEAKMSLENIGLLLRVNIQAEGLNSGMLFNFLENENDLGVS